MGPAQPELKKVSGTLALFTDKDLEDARLRSLSYYEALEDRGLIEARWNTFPLLPDNVRCELC
jgi:hypothetical protein